MKPKSFAKTLSANDVGITGSHQAGILVPKTDTLLLAFFPPLDPSTMNPDTWILVKDDSGKEWKIRFVYYNNRLHSPKGTRNEYRLTHLREYLENAGAVPGDVLVFSADGSPSRYRVSLERKSTAGSSGAPPVIKLRGWRRVH